MWIDSHCHLDAPELGPSLAERLARRDAARAAGVALCVLPAVACEHFDGVRELAHRTADAYALGVHPLWTPQAPDDALAHLDAALAQHRDDPRLVAVGEIGLDLFVPALAQGPARQRQWAFYTGQLDLARRHRLPVILHVRRSADWLLQGLRACPVAGGIVHAFNGSLPQARAFLDRGFRLGFGGTLSYERARQIRRLFTTLPPEALVLETDAPDMPPHWLYVTAEARRQGVPATPNTPDQLPRVGALAASLRGMDVVALADLTRANAVAALPRLAALLPAAPTRAAEACP